jgi:hypothetical protein
MLSHRWFVNVILLLIVFILGLLVIYTRHQTQRNTEVQQPLTPLKSNDIQNIRIQRNEQPEIQLTRIDANEWQMLKPFNLSARSFRVNGLLQILTRSNYVRLNEEIPDLSALKLNPPIARIWFNDFNISLGDSAPIHSKQRYALIGRTVYLLDDHFDLLLGHSAADFVSLFPFGQQASLNKLLLPQFTLEKIEGQWQVTETRGSVSYSLDSSAIADLVGRWQNLQALNVSLQTPDETEWQDSPVVQVHMNNNGANGTNEPPLRLYRVNTRPELILAVPDRGIRYHFSATQADLLALTAENQAN